MTKLRLKIKQLKDGRFYVKYYWSIWEDVHRAYFDTKQDLIKFLENIVKRTMWI